MTARARATDQGGFALIMVVLLLFAIAMAGVTGYQVVSNEFVLATQSRDGQQALTVARAGLQRFMGETVGHVGSSWTSAIGGGIATVTTRKVFQRDSLNVLYYIRSEGSVTDPRSPAAPTKRVVGEYAWHRLNPIPLRAAMTLSGGLLYQYGTPNHYSYIDGRDKGTTADCAFGGTWSTIQGVATAGSRYAYDGPSALYPVGPGAGGAYSYSSFGDVYNTVGVRWDILRDPSFPVDFEGSMPNFGSLNPDSFPIIRYIGSKTLYSYHSGWGVLIVTDRITIGSGFVWNGIILAGRYYYSDEGSQVNGMFIGGLNDSNPNSFLIAGGFNYNSCHAYRANRSLSYLEVLDNTLYEING